MSGVHAQNKNRRGQLDGEKGRRVRSANRRSRGSLDSQLGLVAETLLVAISLHTLTTLMLADLGLTTLFEVTHSSSCLA